MDIRLLTPADAALLDHVADGVFDNPVDAGLTAEFLADPRHHLCVAVDEGAVVGMASAVHYVHPDKRPQLWINEVAVAPTHQRRGLARGMLERLELLGRELGCTEAWVLTDDDNAAARATYASAGGVESLGVVMVTFPFED
jgi:GNAT superfamily N-acetyltransferase